ncbi:MAG: penicillin-binding protein 1B [Pseudomonadota bacterium]|nr:MAG: penicillin-binding protein 1B [Pseudomonadota bacterium]
MARSRWKIGNLVRPLLALLALAVIAGAIYVGHLDRIVTRQFEGRRWTLPAQVYAAPLELYAGLPLTRKEIEKELERLHYRPVEKLERPGTYRRRGNRFDVALRPARFADETRPARILTIVSGPTAIESLRDPQGREVPLERLEPLLIGSIFPIHGEDRIVVAPEDVPPLLPAALKAVEDRTFDTHFGIDPKAILRALWVNLRAGGIEQGGSTLTQQLVKSYFLDPRQTLGRKIREAIMAMALEARFDKADLMNAYINEIYLGQDGRRAVHGFGLASQFYFGKPLAELDLHEIALLVAVVRGPSYYDPRRHPDRARARRDLVLRIMAEQGVVSEAEAKAAAARPLGLTTRASGGYYPAYLDFVRRTLRRDYREEDLTEAGLTIFTSFDPRAQEHAERVMENELARLDRARKQPEGSLEGALVITAPQSGEVIAIVGGRRAGYDGFNRALDARRQIGSLVKPFVYLSAIETGRYTAASVVEDAPVEIPLPGNKVWKPSNITRQTYGPVPLVRALAESMNLATVSLGMDIGLREVARTLRRFGLQSNPELVPALLLGALELTPLEVAQLYSGLAAGGFSVPLRAVRAVVSAEGEIVRPYPLEVRPVAAPENVYQVNQMLEQVMLRGSGRAARAILPPGLVVAGKTGTSSEFRDSWFAGFSGGHLAVVWVGYDDNRPTGLTGSAGALAIWSRVMAGLDTTPWMAPLPESLTEVWIEYSTGLRVEPGCSDEMISIAVAPGSEPPWKPGCRRGDLEGIVERAGRWLRDIIR